MTTEPLDPDEGPEEYDDGYEEPDDTLDDYGFSDEDVLHFDAPRRTPQDVSLVPFTIGDDPQVLISRRPKQAVLVKLAKIADSKDPLVVAGIVDEFMRAALLPESREYLTERFEDPEDDWDYEVLVPVIEQLKGRWFPGVPPGRRTGSGRTQKRSGRRSTVRSR